SLKWIFLGICMLRCHRNHQIPLSKFRHNLLHFLWNTHRETTATFYLKRLGLKFLIPSELINCNPNFSWKDTNIPYFGRFEFEKGCEIEYRRGKSVLFYLKGCPVKHLMTKQMVSSGES